MNILAIDPGAETCACAWFANDVLIDTEFTLTPDGRVGFLPDGIGLDAVIVERMQADERTRGIDIRYLLACAFNGGAAAAFAAGQAGAPLHDFTPKQWKGEEPKPVQHARLFGVNSDLTGEAAVLTPAEQAVVGGAATARAIAAAVDKGARDRWGHPGADYYARNWTMHNLLDAVALGCWFLGRLKKR